MRVLIVEDKRSLARQIGTALKDEGHTTAHAYDGEEALTLGKTNEFDLLILDVMLPKMDGFTVIRKLREDRLSTQTIIVSSCMAWMLARTIISPSHLLWMFCWRR
jgi:DNA-binding response OmpR family regulator